MMKRMLSLVLSFMLTASGVLCSETIAFGSTDTVVFCESFDGFATFDTPDDFTMKGRRSRIENYGEANKVYSFYLDNSKQSIDFSADVSGDYYIGFDIITTDIFDGGFYITNGTASNDVLKFADRNLLAHNGKRLSGLATGSVSRVVFEVDSRTNTYAVYVNGKKILSTYYNTQINLSTADGFGFYFKSAVDTKVMLDKVFAGKGRYSIDVSLPTQAYNPESLEETPVYEATVTDDVYFKYEFTEGEKSYGTFNQKDNIISVETDLNGNGVCTFEKINASDMHLDITDMSILDDVSTSLVYQFDICVQSSAAAFSLALKDSAGEYLYPLSLKAGGVISGAGSSTSLSLNRWYTVSLVYDWYNGYYSVYVDGDAISSKYAVSEKYDHTMGSIWRFHTTAAVAYGCKYSLDNICIYGGTQPRDISVQEQKKLQIDLDEFAIFASEKPAIQYLSDKTAYHTRSGVLWANGEKTLYTPKTADGIAMAPIDMFKKAFGIDCGFDSSSGKITIGTLTLNVNSTSYISGAKQFSLPTAPKVYDGVCYVPVEAVCKDGLGKAVTPVDAEELINDGLILITDTKVSLPDTARTLEDVNAFMFYLRPDSERIKSDYEASPLKGIHPRLMATEEDFARLRELVKTDVRMQKSYDGILRSADILLDKELLKYELRDGVRLWYVSLDFVEYMETLGIAYHISGDRKYADRAYEEMLNIANFPDWHPEHHIDVGAMAIGYAIGYDWFYNALTPEQRTKLEEAAYEQCFYLYANGFMNKQNDMKDGIIAGQNHNQVMNAGSIMAAIAFADVYPEVAYYLISGSIRATEESIHHFAPNGSWYEGIGYGAMTLNYYSYMLSSLEKVLGSLYTLDYSEGTDRAAEFIFNMQGPAVSFGFNDGKAFNAVFNQALLWFADHYDQNGLIAKWYRGNPNYNMANARAMLWYDPEVINAADVSVANDIYYSGDEVVTARDSWDGTMAFFGARGGRPQAVHGHMDVGSFVYGTGTTPWIVSSPNPDYNGTGYWDYAGVTGMRWKYYTLRAEANNCIIINPNENGEYDPHIKAKFNRYESKPRGVIAVLDMTDSQNGKAVKAERAYYLADDRNSLVIRDEINLSGKSEVYSFLYTNQNVTTDGKTVTLTSQTNPSEKLKIEFLCSEDFEVVTDTPQPLEQGKGEIIVNCETVKNRIYLRTEGAGNISVTVKLTPSFVANPQSIEKFNIPIASWQIPDGERRVLPKLDTLSVDGVEFSADELSAQVRVLEGETPNIKAESSKYNVEVIPSSEAYGDTVIKVTDKNDASNYSLYTVSYNVISADSGLNLDGIREIAIKTLEVSNEPEPTNGKDNLIDRNLNTRWSADGVEYALANLGEVQNIDTVIMAFHNGDSRVYDITIEVSEDGINFERVYSGKSSGTTAGYEQFFIGNRSAKYVRVTGSGSSTNAWNSWNELVIGKRG